MRALSPNSTHQSAPRPRSVTPFFSRPSRAERTIFSIDAARACIGSAAIAVRVPSTAASAMGLPEKVLPGNAWGRISMCSATATLDTGKPFPRDLAKSSMSGRRCSRSA